MKKSSVWKPFMALALLAVALVVGLAFVGCKNDADNPLNGRWLAVNGGIELTLSNGNLSFKLDDADYMKLKYTDSGSSLVMTITDMYLDAAAAAEVGSTVGWKNKSQITELMKQMGMTDAQINEQFAPMTCPYTLDGDTLKITGFFQSGSTTFTRQP